MCGHWTIVHTFKQTIDTLRKSNKIQNDHVTPSLMVLKVVFRGLRGDKTG